MQNNKQAFKFDLKRLITLAIPILIGQVAQNSMGLVDTIMAGRVSSTDMAAVSVGASIWLPLVLFGLGLLLSIPPTVSYLNGSNQRHRISHYVRQGVWIAIFISIPISIIVYNSHYILAVFNMEANLSQITEDYLKAMSFGALGYLLTINFRGLNDGVSRTKPAMIVMFIGLLLNIPLNYIFIYGVFGFDGLGAVGCGVATAIVNWLMFFMMLWYSKKAKNLQDLKLFDAFEKPNLKTIKRLLGVGFPIGLAICAEVILFALTSLLLSPLGANVVASHQIALNTSSLIYMIPMSLGMAATILIGQRLGEKRVAQAKKVSYIALGLGIILAVITAVITLYLKTEIAAIFVEDKEVIAIASSLLTIAAIYQLPDTVQCICGGIMRGYKDTKILLKVLVISFCVVGLPLGYVLALTDFIVPHLAAKGFWYGFVISLSIASLLLFYKMRQIHRQDDDIIIAKME